VNYVGTSAYARVCVPRRPSSQGMHSAVAALPGAHDVGFGLDNGHRGGRLELPRALRGRRESQRAIDP
jgi:hypothetical protein